jgi:hypothetical protein
MELRQNILNYYFAHFAELPQEKQFHFCTRLAAWEQNPRALDFLARYKSTFVPHPATTEALQAVLKELITDQDFDAANAAELRAPYFKEYPWLRGLELALFRVRHWLIVYNVDAREALFNLVPKQQLIDYKDQLMQDDEALRILSTYAVNYVYLLESVVLERPDTLDIDRLFAIGEGYDSQDQFSLQLRIYYYTHCIIAESDFYAMQIPQKYLATYIKMLQVLEEIIADRFELLSLDTKLEFLVCCRICNYQTDLESRINQECKQSKSPHGDFLIDVKNAFATRTDKKDLIDSEHRNVLFILSGSWPNLR